jgi:3'-phosphoadenosine 5'-phosphosulfate sulfotransferase (PAPS reductase)/FAD synthetase
MKLPTDREWAWVVVNSSSGKDSQTALRATVKACKESGYPLEQVVVSHQDLGRVEWEGCRELVRAQATHYGLPLRVTQYRDKDGNTPDLLEYVRRRKKWPSSTARFCTSEYKRGPGNRVLTALRRERPGYILQVFGFRAEESPARKKRPVLARNGRASNKAWDVFDWLPIHTWTTEQVWHDIIASGVPYHPAYDLGMPRLSCCFCVFAPKPALIRAGKANPGLLDEYVSLEAEIGHDFQHNKPIRLIKEAIAAGEQPEECNGAWNM